ncbi:MAG: fatty acid desaturase [Gammaproteobacteria bacterium]|nr:fatty acid desaturase [Gammaproteobacteria bacterium]
MTLSTETKDGRPAWRRIVAKYEKPNLGRSLGQIASTMIPYFAILCVMYLTLEVSYWITLALAFPAAGFLTRNFIICHDCGHGSFFKSKKANRILGFVSGVLTFLPSYYWSHEHAKHHAAAGDLDRRGHGDIWTLTVQEYLALSRGKRIWYRLYRNPFFLFGVAPIFVFLVNYRYWRRGDTARDRWSTIRTNLALVAIVIVASLTIGIKAYVMIQVPIMIVAGAFGVWLFYVQHQFENTYWERHENWNYVQHALKGSSFYKLPGIFQWFSGNIGFHHVHHLSPRIPNYYLQKCHESHPMFQEVKHVTLWSSMKCLGYRMWDEERKKLVGFSYVSVYLAKQAMPSGQ